MAKQPMQPIVWADNGQVIRFQKNEIVEYLLDNGGIDLNKIAILNFSDEDRMQFAQLIGYSVSGFGDLHYAKKKVVRKADEIAHKMFVAKKAEEEDDHDA